MKVKNRLVYIFAILIIPPLVGTVAQAQTLTVLQRFDFPSQNNKHVPTASTLPQKVSDQGDLVGTVVDVNGTSRGFIYKFRLGKFSEAFSAPDDTGNDTQGRGINILRHSVGEYKNGSDGTLHGYILRHAQVPPFVDFDVPNASQTIPLGINNNGDFVGTAMFATGQPAFVSVLQTLTTFSVPAASATFAYQINDSGQIIGYYIDADGVTAHGFTRDSAGNLTFPIDVPGATKTYLFGNNAMNWGVGSYIDAAGKTHGLYFITPDNIQTFDAPFPGVTLTSLDGINKNGAVCGYYIDTAGAAHGLVAQLNPPASPTPTPTPTP
jgi:uncharacterized membrane protein